MDTDINPHTQTRYRTKHIYRYRCLSVHLCHFLCMSCPQGTFADAALRSYHRRLQFFLLFFIDRSSFINDSDLVWEVILLFEKKTPKGATTSSLTMSNDADGTSSTTSSSSVYNIVGYTTLYKFLHYPDEWRLRLSQILILPPYQRCGHGQHLLTYVNGECQRRDLCEVNIEDPAPAFQALRDLTDVYQCKRLSLFSKHADEQNEGPGAACQSWDPIYGEQVSRLLRVPLKQVRRCYEIFKLAQTDIRQPRLYEAYRLEVKRRLYVEHEELLSVNWKAGEERKQRLHQMYTQLEQHYHEIIKKARIH
jgi:histone acetyltransferase 1